MVTNRRRPSVAAKHQLLLLMFVRSRLAAGLNPGRWYREWVTRGDCVTSGHPSDQIGARVLEQAIVHRFGCLANAVAVSQLIIAP